MKPSLPTKLLRLPEESQKRVVDALGLLDATDAKKVTEATGGTPLPQDGCDGCTEELEKLRSENKKYKERIQSLESQVTALLKDAEIIHRIRQGSPKSVSQALDAIERAILGK